MIRERMFVRADGTPTGRRTPWGRADRSKIIARGIVRYDTPSHGGYHLSKARNDAVHTLWRRRDGWYEEDCEWAIVVLTFGDLFTTSESESARLTAKRWYPEVLLAIMPGKLASAIGEL